MNSLYKWSASFLNFFSQFHKNSCREAEISVGKKVELTGTRSGRQEKILSGQQLRTWGKTRKSHIREQNATVTRQFFPLVTFIDYYFTVLHVYSKKLQILKMKKGAKISLLPSTNHQAMHHKEPNGNISSAYFQRFLLFWAQRGHAKWMFSQLWVATH